MKTTIFLATLAMFVVAGDGQQKFQLTGMFSDMHYIQGAGDLLGTEIFITYGGGKYWAQFQESEGEPAPPQLVKPMLDGNKISFDVSQDSILHSDGKETPIQNVLHFTGEITPDRLVGTIEGRTGFYNLPRTKSHWQ